MAIFGLLLVSVVIHAQVFRQTVVAARDGIGYIRYALLLEHQPWRSVLRHAEQHPGYPIFLDLVSWPIRSILGLTPDAMMLSARLASSFAAVALVVPMFLLGRELATRRTAFGATLLFTCLPVVTHCTSDALSEALFLFLAVTALAFAARGLRRHSPGMFALCGLGGGLAYLTRPEGLVVPAATAVVLVLLPLLRHRAWSWRSALLCLTALGATTLLTAGPYALTIGGLTVKPSALRILGTLDRDDDWLDQSAPEVSALPATPLVAATCGIWVQATEQRTLAWGFKTLLAETVRAFAGVFVVAALIGVGIETRRLRRRAAWWVVLLTASVVWLLLLGLATVNGYVSERHLLLVLLIGCYPAAATLMRCGDLTAHWLRSERRWRTLSAGSWLGLAVLVCLPSALKPLHGNRLGHREVGKWLALHARAEDAILDPRDWAPFYAGRMLARESVEDLDGKDCYVVLEESAASHSFLPLLARARELAARGRLVYQWPPSTQNPLRDRSDVVAVYEVSPAR